MTKQAHTAEFGGALAPPAIGDVIAGKYRVESVVGSGGMGVVLCATHQGLGQKVAIKVLSVPEDDERRTEAHERFLREGRATAALVSDHVVRVYDVGTLDNGAPFMVMELLRGQDLAAMLAQHGPFGIELAADCVKQATEAIACAHAQGIVHRDLKPSNLFLTQRSDGSALVKVLDFGISKTTSTELESLTGNLTAARSVLGTPFYMSPEQVRDAKQVDVRTDIWSLGLILHELLTGSPAFEGSTLPGVCAAIAADPPAALRLKRPEVPVELEAIVLKCLEKDPARRFQTARALASKLSPWTGRTESGIASPLSDQTIRSSPLFELSELRDGSTVALPTPDSGTLASAVFTQSGERVVGASATKHSKLDATQSQAPSSPAEPAARVASAPSKRKLAVIGGGILAFVLLFAALHGHRSAPLAEASAPIVEPSPPVAAPLPVAAPSSTFALQIDSAPAGAAVYEAGNLLGATPLHLTFDSSSAAKQPRSFSLRKPGFLPYTIVQGASANDARVVAELAKEPVSAAALPKPPAARKKPTLPHVPSAPVATSKPGNDIFMQR